MGSRRRRGFDVRPVRTAHAWNDGPRHTASNAEGLRHFLLNRSINLYQQGARVNSASATPVSNEKSATPLNTHVAPSPPVPPTRQPNLPAALDLRSSSSSESISDSHGRYVRPMQRNSKGQVIPLINIASKQPPPSRDNRSRPSRPTTNSSFTSITSSSFINAPLNQLPLVSERTLLRDGPEIKDEGPPQPARTSTVERPAIKDINNIFESSNTLDGDFGSTRRRPFTCCRTM